MIRDNEYTPLECVIVFPLSDHIQIFGSNYLIYYYPLVILSGSKMEAEWGVVKIVIICPSGTLEDGVAWVALA